MTASRPRGGDVLLRGALLEDGRAVDVHLAHGRIAAVGEAGTLAGDPVIDVAGRRVMPALVNAHDHLDMAAWPALGSPPYANGHEWAEDVSRADPDAVRAAMAVPPADALWLGGLRNLIAGATAVLHHAPWHRSLSRDDFPVRVQERYQFAPAAGPRDAMRRTYRSTDRRIPWVVHAGAGTDARAAADLDLLREANVLRHNAVLVHALAMDDRAVKALAEREACVVWCPQAERRIFGATADVRRLREAGVRIGLGSDSPATGARDILSTLAAARAENVMDDAELLLLATAGSATVSRLEGGGLAVGDRADLLVTSDLDRLLAGDRRAVSLVVRGGRPVYGEPALVGLAGSLTVDGEPRALAGDGPRRLAALLRAHRSLARVDWLSEVSA